MKVLFLIPQGKFNYKAPWTPLGALSITTHLKQNGFTVRFIDRSFDRMPVRRLLDFSPDAVCVSVPSVRCLKDAIRISAEIRPTGLPVIWGGYFPSEDYRECLQQGYADYVSLGEGEFSVCELLRALQNGEDPQYIKGIAFLRDGQVHKTDARPPTDLASLPVIDSSFCNPDNYLHHYLFCNKMMYLYASKGCPGHCTFCSNPQFHCGTFRARPVEYVIREIQYLVKNHGMDGVYFSDECWYLNKAHMREFCLNLEEKALSICWGCELRVDVYDEEDLRFMYEHGCRWIFFGVESGDPEMLKRLKKHTNTKQIRSMISACKKIGIVAIASFIIGLPNETPEQLKRTLSLINEVEAGINVCNIFTPMPHSELCDELIRKGEYTLPDTLEGHGKTMTGEYSPYRCSTIPHRDLQVIRSHYLWKGFIKKSVTNEAKNFEVALTSIRETLISLRRMGLKGSFSGMRIIAGEFFPIFWFANFYPGIRRKYDLK